MGNSGNAGEDALHKGDKVKANEDFESDFHKELHIVEGTIGTIIDIDSDGDAEIDFEGHEVKAWLLSDRLHMLTKARHGHHSRDKEPLDKAQTFDCSSSGGHAFAPAAGLAIRHHAVVPPTAGDRWQDPNRFKHRSVPAHGPPPPSPLPRPGSPSPNFGSHRQDIRPHQQPLKHHSSHLIDHLVPILGHANHPIDSLAPTPFPHGAGHSTGHPMLTPSQAIHPHQRCDPRNQQQQPKYHDASESVQPCLTPPAPLAPVSLRPDPLWQAITTPPASHMFPGSPVGGMSPSINPLFAEQHDGKPAFHSPVNPVWRRNRQFGPPQQAVPGCSVPYDHPELAIMQQSGGPQTCGRPWTDGYSPHCFAGSPMSVEAEQGSARVEEVEALSRRLKEVLRKCQKKGLKSGSGISDVLPKRQEFLHDLRTTLQDAMKLSTTERDALQGFASNGGKPSSSRGHSPRTDDISTEIQSTAATIEELANRSSFRSPAVREMGAAPLPHELAAILATAGRTSENEAIVDASWLVDPRLATDNQQCKRPLADLGSGPLPHWSDSRQFLRNGAPVIGGALDGDTTPPRLLARHRSSPLLLQT